MSHEKKINFKKIFTWILVIGISVIFVGMFTISGLSNTLGGGHVLVGKVNKTPIYDARNSDFSQTFYSMMESYKNAGQMPKGFDLYVKQRAFQQVALRVLFQEFADKNKIFVSDKTVLNHIKQTYFVKDGKFLEAQYNAFKKRGDIATKQDLEKKSRRAVRELILNQYTLFPYFPVSKYEFIEYQKAKQTQKKVIVAYVELDKILANYITANDLKTYYEANKSKYKKPFNLIKNEITIDYINENGYALNQKAASDLESKIQSALVAKKFGKNFTLTAKSLGLKVTTSDYFNIFSETISDINDQEITALSGNSINEQLFSLKKGEISSVLKSKNAIAISKVIDVKKTKVSKTSSMSSFLKKKFIKSEMQEKQQLAYGSYANLLYTKGRVEFLLNAAGKEK